MSDAIQGKFPGLPSSKAGSPYNHAELSSAIKVILLVIISIFTALVGPRAFRETVALIESGGVVANLAYLTHRIIRVRRLDYVIAFCVFIGMFCFLLMYCIVYGASTPMLRE